MADLNQAPPQSAKCWPTFANGQVAALGILDLIEWVSASDRALEGGDSPETMPVVAMPPIQRTAVWHPRQVLNLWDSVLRGLPIGVFYLVERPAGTHKVRPVNTGGNDNQTIKDQIFKVAGFDLLDGQQRVRALLAGAHGPVGGTLCLWVDLGAANAGKHPCLRVTSKAQPFGYDGTSGDKLSIGQRRKARMGIEPHPETHPLWCGDRPAYDLDLFDGPVTRDKEGKERIAHPPMALRHREDGCAAHLVECLAKGSTWRRGCRGCRASWRTSGVLAQKRRPGRIGSPHAGRSF